MKDTTTLCFHLPCPRQIWWASLQIELKRISEFVDFAGQAFNQQFGSFSARVGSLMTNLTEAERSHMEERFIDEAIQIRDEFPRFAWRTSYVAAFSVVEDAVVRLIKATSVSSDKNVYIDSLKELLKEYDSDLLGVSTEWEELKDIKAVRNLIVHQLGRIPMERDHRHEQVLRYVNANPELFYIPESSSNLYEIVPKKDGVKRIVDVSQAFFVKLYAELEASSATE